ncbi:C6 zinc finger domain-containing protein [Pleurostoma richardsiae]|uniref:C6 zinc finger domain-containing protein n=1 Tax=Pleurostoma richardsiae TaxID=41990 RepID=A0AA38VDG3_9PEZI|nr:C6 zinc finger domain-containing protein [Pleurostoma richardsiae]
MNTILPFEAYLRGTVPDLFDRTSQVYSLLDRCKQLARVIKADRPIPQSLSLDVRDYLPARIECDELLSSYFRTFETVFRVLHVPTFMNEYISYWDDPSAANDAFLAKLLLILAIGTCFSQPPAGPRDFYHRRSWQWIYVAQMWLGGPCEKRRLGPAGVQVHCLILVALQTGAVGADLSWITAGSLLRAAMTSGLHRDPAHFPFMPALEAEVRRRLWATVLELVLQSSLDSGMPPLVCLDDFDTEPPANIDDDQLDGSTTAKPRPQPIAIFTQTSIQCALVRSLALRFKVVKALNNLRSDLSHEEALHLGSELRNTCRSNSALFRSFLSPHSGPTTQKPSMFQIKLLDTLTRRFVLEIHAPFSMQANSNLAYYFSRKICLESSLLLLSYINGTSPQPAAAGDDYSCLQLYGRGLFKFIFIHASTTLALEVIDQLQEDSSPFAPSLPDNDLYRATRDIAEIAYQRISIGETSVIMYVCLICVVGYIDAIHSGNTACDNIVGSAIGALETSYELLRSHALKRGLLADEDAGKYCDLSDQSALDELLFGGAWEDEPHIQFDLSNFR